MFRIIAKIRYSGTDLGFPGFAKSYFVQCGLADNAETNWENGWLIITGDFNPSDYFGGYLFARIRTFMLSISTAQVSIQNY